MHKWNKSQFYINPQKTAIDKKYWIPLVFEFSLTSRCWKLGAANANKIKHDIYQE